MDTAAAVRRVQTWYPQIYLACHVDHKRAKSTASGITSRESALLAHLHEERPQTAAALARHFQVGAPSMSAILKRLRTRGLVRVGRSVEDSRKLEVRLTAAGVKALSEGSVLDTGRLQKMLARLSAAERRRALDGLSLLARAARELGGA